VPPAPTVTETPGRFLDACAVSCPCVAEVNAKYFESPNVRGRLASDPAIDRYSSPGISALVSLSYGW